MNRSFPGSRLIQFCLASLFFWSPVVVSSGEEFEPATFVVDDHAAVIPLLEGIRRVRVSYLDEAGEWQLYSMAHLAGDEGRIKLRLPNGLTLDRVRIEVSSTDPFPYEVYQGSSDFVTEVDGSVSLLAPTGGDRATTDAAGAENADGAAPEVQESDLWKWDGDTLYFYNQLRGLQVFDFSDPAQPEQIDSIRMPALGEDMYLHPDGRHLVLLAKRWSWGDAGESSEAVVVGLEGEALEIVERIPLPGNSVVESRMVGSHLYVAMRNSRRLESVDEEGERLVQWETGLTVEHLDLSDPAQPEVATSLDLFSADGWWAQAVVSASSEYFIVAPSVYDRDEREYHSTLHLIDIRDQDAPLGIAASVELEGQLKDKFKLRIDGDILTCVTQGGGWRDNLRTVVASYDLDGGSGTGGILPLDRLALAPEETLFATRFDGDRVYVVTAIQIDPLFVVDLSDPRDLQLLGELKIPGWSHYLQPRGDRLLSVGVEDRRVAISQFDVSDPANMGPPLRVYLGEEGDYSWSEGNYDEQAIGYFPDRGVMIVPYQSYGGDWNSSGTALQILTFTDDSLEKAGVIRTDFVARRATLIDDETLVSVSGREVSALNVADLANPQPLSSLEVAWPVDHLLSHGDYLLQIEGGNYFWHWGDSPVSGMRIRVSLKDDPDRVLARVEVPGSNLLGMELAGDSLHLLTSHHEIENVDDPFSWRQVAYHQVVDLRDPLAPVSARPKPFDLPILHQDYRGRLLKRGRVAWIPEAPGRFGGWWGLDLPMRGHWWSGPRATAQIVVVDASNPASPKLLADHRIGIDRDGPPEDEENVLPEGNSSFSGLVEQNGDLFLSFRRDTRVSEPDGERSSYETEHHLRVVTLSDDGVVSVGVPVSVPGKVEGVRAVDESGWLLLSSAPDTSTGEGGWVRWNNDLLLQTSAFDGLTAFLIDEVSLPDAYWRDLELTSGHFAVPDQVWTEEEQRQGIDFYPFDRKGAIGEPLGMDLTFYPHGLVYREGILSANGWNEGGQFWWMLDMASLSDPEPTVLETFNRFYVDLQEALFDLEAQMAWFPVGPYGVERVDLAPLLGKGRSSGALQGLRTKNAPSSWVAFRLQSGQLAPADSDRPPGTLAENEVWRFQPVEAVTYDDWMARHLGEVGNPEFAVPLEGEDFDGDGLSNWLEYAFGLDPRRRDSAGLQIKRSVSSGLVEVAFEVPSGHRGVTWEIQQSGDLLHWAPTSMVEMSAAFVDEKTKRVSALLPTPDGRETVFYRLNFK